MKETGGSLHSRSPGASSGFAGSFLLTPVPIVVPQQGVPGGSPTTRIRSTQIFWESFFKCCSARVLAGNRECVIHVTCIDRFKWYNSINFFIRVDLWPEDFSIILRDLLVIIALFVYPENEHASWPVQIGVIVAIISPDDIPCAVSGDRCRNYCRGGGYGHGIMNGLRRGYRHDCCAGGSRGCASTHQETPVIRIASIPIIFQVFRVPHVSLIDALLIWSRELWSLLLHLRQMCHRVPVAVYLRWGVKR